MSFLRRMKRKGAPQSVVIPLNPKGEKRVCVATPCGDTTQTGYTASLIEMVMRTLGSEFPPSLGELQVRLYASSILPYSRQKLASDAIADGFTHLLSIDSDMGFPSDLILRLLRHDAPIVAANCTSRRPPYRCTAQSAPGIEVQTLPQSTGLETVYRAGFGLIWFDLSIFASIPKPWFEFIWLPDAEVYLGEDYTFSEKARAAGFEIAIDHDLSKEVRHIGTFDYNPILRAAIDVRRAERAA